MEAIEEQDFARRRQRNRRSGGFLLDTTFARGPWNRHSYNGAHTEDVKGKRRSHRGDVHEGENQQRTSRAGDAGSNGSPLSREARMHDRDAEHGQSIANSALSQNQASDGLNVAKTRVSVQEKLPIAYESDPVREPTLPQSTIDPNQIVHMALNLSESRRRNLSAGQLLVSPPRAQPALQRDGSHHYRTGSSLKQYLNEQRRVSRNISPHGGEGSPLRHRGTPTQRSNSLYIHGRVPQEATFTRRDKARAFFELRMEYLRLLDYLPPLKPDSSEPSNFIVTANNVPGSPQAQITRIPSYVGKKYELGRPYNPLQFLRNRRARARERKALDHPPEEFSDVDQVRDWVDRVEKATRHPQYRQQDGVLLPKFHEDHEPPSTPTKPSRPKMVWMFSAEELLADAHWLEHGDNKTVIEDRHGRKIFPPKEPQKQDLLQPRLSKEYPEKRRRSWVEGLPGIAVDSAPAGDESDPTSERGRKRRLLPTFRAESPKHKKHTRAGSQMRTGSWSDSSDSDSDARQHRSRRPRRVIDVDNNTGPLELRMRELMEQEEREAQAKVKSPAIFTPDTPNKWGRDDGDVADPKVSHSSLEVPGSANGSAKHSGNAGLKLVPTHRTQTLASPDPLKEPRSSLEALDGTAPSTPLHARPFPHIGSDLSRPPSRAGSEARKPKKSKLDIFRSDESTKNQKHEHPVEPDSAGSDKKRYSRPIGEDADEGNGFGSALWAAPGAVKNLLGHRKNDSVSSLPSPIKENRRESKDVKEPPSAVTRFFKGVKTEGSKVGEFIFRKDRPPEESDTDITSDLYTAAESESGEDTGKREGRRRPDLARSTTVETTDTLTSKKTNRYHLDLPSFRSSNQNQNKGDEDHADATDSQLPDHPITRQARERANSRSPRFDQLAPPGLDLSQISTSSIRSPSQERMSKVLARPGGVGQGGLPVTALAKGGASNEPSLHHKSSRPTLDGKRHWSITDENDNAMHRKVTPSIVTEADIARVRALFLCSGVKAKEIARRASEVRTKPAAFLLSAARTVNAPLYPVSRKEEHVLAARILTRNLESSTQALQSSAEYFRSSTVTELTSMISTLNSSVETGLLPRVRNSSDEAVRIAGEIASTAPLEVKQISDEIDRMIRARRRRMRWVRHVGWELFGWMIRLSAWLAWLFVTVFKSGVRLVLFGYRIVRWLLWL